MSHAAESPNVLFCVLYAACCVSAGPVRAAVPRCDGADGAVQSGR
jgi:hypothetical protein